ncbi:hypothetical protein M407DRAFT_135960 [Tulasnella calospora MUT 4182]|uniref:Uncharacterized protein n=1 Tax=Tulasnella calospora MUT 4182 TaxID=1051891 RepID=A0A0C3LBS4_9AGAM|nr:hypothetical protein M407DRAFT_135960 [Tulasnella calospora MUT 4182]
MSQTTASHPFVPDPIEYEPPKVVESLKQGWIGTYQAIAVVAALFAGMEATLITLAKTAEPDSHPPLRWSASRIQNTTLALAYVALICSIGSIMSALKIIDGLGHMTFRNSIKTPESPLDWTRQRASYLMKPFGVAGNFRRLMYHCVGSLLVSGLCALLQILLYIWQHEATSVAIVASVAIAVASWPILVMFS